MDWEGFIESLHYGCEEDYILYNMVENGATVYYETPSMKIDEAVANIMNQLDIVFAEIN